MILNKKYIIFWNLFLFFLCVSHCKESLFGIQAELDENKVDTNLANNFNYAYVLNPNGISLYEKANDFKSKITDIPYGQKIIMTYEQVSGTEEVSKWTSVSFNGKNGYVYSIEPYKDNDWIVLNPLEAYNENTKKNEPAFSIVQSPKTILYELPNLNAKQITELEQFTLVPILTSGSSFDIFINNNIDLELGGNDRIWYEVLIGEQRGFILNSINYPTTKVLAEEQANNKILNQKGYFLLTSQNPKLFSMENKLAIDKDYTVKIKSKSVFLNVSESRLINGDQVYLVNLGEKISLKRKDKNKEEDYPPYAAYISDKYGMFFTEQKFSDYTVANTRYKGDMNVIRIVREEFEKRGIYLNYLDFSVKKISDGKYSEDNFLIASAYTEYFENEISGKPNLRSIILKQTDGVYETVSGSIYTNNPIQYRDLDNDGTMEVMVKNPTRGRKETVIYGLKDGRYI